MKSSKKNMGLNFEARTELLMSCFKSGPPATASGILLGDLVTCDVPLVVSQKNVDSRRPWVFACLVSYITRTLHNLTYSGILRQYWLNAE